MSYAGELVHGATAYRLNRNEEQIRAEIFRNGPVVAGFNVYTDFLQYKSGKEINFDFNTIRSKYASDSIILRRPQEASLYHIHFCSLSFSMLSLWPEELFLIFRPCFRETIVSQ